MTAYAAVFVPLFVACPLVFAIVALDSTLNIATISLTIGCFCCSLIFFLYAKQFAKSLYSWGIFEENSVTVKTAFIKPYRITYSKCRSCGIGYYNHGILNSNLGTTHYYIFLSYDRFDESFRERMNYYKPSNGQIKVGYSHALYLFLMKVLPPKLASDLQRDYNRYLTKFHNPK